MNSYKLMQDGFVMRESDKAVFGPLSPTYKEYIADVAAGAVVEQFDYAAEEARQAAAETEKKRLEAEARLIEIDLKSIRAIREYIAAKPDAPQVLRDREAEAVAERVRP